ncbi:MAG: SAM-dependent chlorinase/fluorinase [Candidatus Micrarchaeota archaeon]
MTVSKTKTDGSCGRSAEFAARRASDFEKRNPLICLVTDYGRDEAPHLVRSAIRAIRPDARIEDVTHEIPAFNILIGAWRLSRVVGTPTEAEGTIYVAVVDPGVGGNRKSLIVRTNNGQYLVGPDNGLLSLAFQDSGIDCAVSIDNQELTLLRFAKSSTFEGKDTFGPVAAHLANGVGISEFGEPVDPAVLRRISLAPPGTESVDSHSGYLVDIDSFGNLRTTIGNGAINGADGARVIVSCRGFKKLDGVFRRTGVCNFESGKDGDFLLVHSSTGFLDIALNQADASKRLRIDSNDISLLTRNDGLRPSADILISTAARDLRPVDDSKPVRPSRSESRCTGISGLG